MEVDFIRNVENTQYQNSKGVSICGYKELKISKKFVLS